MNATYAVLQWGVVAVAVTVAAWRVWKTYLPKRETDKSGCDAGCPSCNHCTTTDRPPPPGVTPLPRREQPVSFVPRRR